MVQINLREYYPHIHEDRFVEVSDDVAELFLVYRRSEASYARKARRYMVSPSTISRSISLRSMSL